MTLEGMNGSNTIYKAEIGQKWPILASFSQKTPIFSR